MRSLGKLILFVISVLPVGEPDAQTRGWKPYKTLRGKAGRFDCADRSPDKSYASPPNTGLFSFPHRCICWRHFRLLSQWLSSAFMPLVMDGNCGVCLPGQRDWMPPVQLWDIAIGRHAFRIVGWSRRLLQPLDKKGAMMVIHGACMKTFMTTVQP